MSFANFYIWNKSVSAKGVRKQLISGSKKRREERTKITLDRLPE
jgi:hypothetical protein